MYKNIFIHISIVTSSLFLTLIIFTCISDAQTKLLERDSNWTDCSGVPWILDSSSGYNDSFSLRSGPIEVMGLSGICRNFQGPGEVKFMWRTDTSPKLGTMVFFVDGIERNECNSNTWISANYSLRSDRIYLLEWRFVESSPDRWNGHAWLDDITFLPMEMHQGHSNENGHKPEFVPQPQTKNNTPGGTGNLSENITRAEKGVVSIQQAIDNVAENGKVLVFKGDYEENIRINKSIELIGFYNSTIKCKNKNEPTIQITSDDTLISGCTIIGETESINASSYNIKNITIKNNTLIAYDSVIVFKGFTEFYIINNTINKGANRRCVNSIYLDNISESVVGRIYNNSIYCSYNGVRVPKSYPRDIDNTTKLLNAIINQSFVPGKYEEVDYA
jgi:hypothetical protein